MIRRLDRLWFRLLAAVYRRVVRGVEAHARRELVRGAKAHRRQEAVRRLERHLASQNPHLN